MMTDTEMHDLAHLQDVGENCHNISQSLFDAVFMTRYLGSWGENQNQQQKKVCNPEGTYSE